MKVKCLVKRVELIEGELNDKLYHMAREQFDGEHVGHEFYVLPVTGLSYRFACSCGQKEVEVSLAAVVAVNERSH